MLAIKTYYQHKYEISTTFFHIIHDILEKYLKEEVSGKKLLLIFRKEE